MSRPPVRRDRCRLCGFGRVQSFLTLPAMPLPLGHVPPEKKDEAFLADLELFFCPDCLAVQTLVDHDLDDYYAAYSYAVSDSALMRDYTETFARASWDRFAWRAGDRVIEVGSGDGGQLLAFQKRGARVLGVEPSTGLAARAEARGVPTLPLPFDEQTARRLPPDFARPQAIVCQYTFDHLTEPAAFLRAAARLLDPERGVLLIEVHDFEQIVARREGCLFTHEHATYLTAESLANALKVAGLRLVETGLVPERARRGNSLVVAAAMADSHIQGSPLPETALLRSLRDFSAYETFGEDLLRVHQRLAERVRARRRRGRAMAGYGAAGRGVNTCAIAGLTDRDLFACFDKNERLHGLLMPGSLIPVAAPDKLRDAEPCDVIVFSYGYLEEIRRDLAPFIRRGGRLISLLDFLREESHET